MSNKPQETGEQIVERWRKLGKWYSEQHCAPLRETEIAIKAHNVNDCADELATFLEGLRELSAEWPHDFTKLRGPHDGAEKAKCKRCQIEKRLGERVTGGEKCAGSKEAR